MPLPLVPAEALAAPLMPRLSGVNQFGVANNSMVMRFKRYSPAMVLPDDFITERTEIRCALLSLTLLLPSRKLPTILLMTIIYKLDYVIFWSCVAVYLLALSLADLRRADLLFFWCPRRSIDKRQPKKTSPFFLVLIASIL